ncbi:MAG: amidohydrolase family protein, partial [Oscillospiraceae bacterium]
SDEKISVKDGLKAITINAAYQYFEEKEKGSIKVGKKANFVILSENPLTADINNLPNIKVLMTIKDGETIFKLN